MEQLRLRWSVAGQGGGGGVGAGSACSEESSDITCSRTSLEMTLWTNSNEEELKQEVRRCKDMLEPLMDTQQLDTDNSGMTLLGSPLEKHVRNVSVEERKEGLTKGHEYYENILDPLHHKQQGDRNNSDSTTFGVMKNLPQKLCKKSGKDDGGDSELEEDQDMMEVSSYLIQSLPRMLTLNVNYQRQIMSSSTMSLTLSACLTMVLLITAISTASSTANNKATKGRVIRVDGDLILGALFPVHRQPSQKTAFTRKCGEIWEQYGMHRIEVFLKTLDEINSNPNVLPNVTLGCDIRDSCWYAPVALEQSIDFIKNSIASLEKKNQTTKTDCPTTHAKPIAAMIGPGSSTVTIQIQNLLSLFNIPQIGYSATSKDLSDKSLYKYFLRVVPSDKLQARALVDVVLHYNWTYVSTVYTEGNYGFSGMQEFRGMVKKAGLCEATSDKVSNNADDEAYDNVIENLKRTENARVVVCFCEGMTVRKLIIAAERKGAKGHFLFIGSDGWAVRPDVVQSIEDAAAGGMSIKLYSPPLEDFDKHYLSLKPDNNPRNPWFREFWQQRFECYLPYTRNDNQYKRPCTGKEDLSFEYVQDAKLGFVVNAIYTAAYALGAMQRDICGSAGGLCDAMKLINGSLLIEYLHNVSFMSYSNDRIMFNENGDPPGRYDIMNFQKIQREDGHIHYDYVRVGGWDNGNLTMEDSKIFWPNREVAIGAPMVESVCSSPCPKGQVKKIQRGGVHCCWACTPCRSNEIMLDGSTCKACPQGWWPHKDLTACMMIPIEHIQWGDTEAVVAMVFACVGIMTTMFVTTVFMQHNNTAVVKASTRELSYIILFGITVSYITSFPLVAKPSLVTCYLARILPGFSFSLIYGALVTKTNRIARILAGSKKKIMTRKPRFMSACAQVVITCIIIGIECAIITVMLILEPADSKLVYPTKTRVKLTCNATTMGIIVPLGFDIFLIVMCTLYAIKTRNLPENFNEAKFIGFTMYTTCVIWLAFVPIYFGSDNKVITMCLAITLSASVALVLLFFPKIYIIICKPEKNNRSAFTTSKDVRCHIGSTAGRQYSNSNDSVDRHHTGNAMNKRRMVFPWQTATNTKKKHTSAADEFAAQWNEKSFENAALSLYRQKSFFNRWKNKSIKGTTQSGGGRPGAAASRGAAGGRGSSSASAASAASTSYRYKSAGAGYSGGDSGRLYHSRENIPMKDTAGDGLTASGGTKSPRSRRTDESRLGSAPGVGTSWTSVASTSRDSGVTRHSRPSSPHLHDSSVQTDEELLRYLLPGLRRRKTKHGSSAAASAAGAGAATSPNGSTSNKSPSSSEDSHLGLSSSKNGLGGSGGSAGLRGRLSSSASSRSSYHNNSNNNHDGGVGTYDATSAVHHVSVNEFETMDETDSLLENEHKADTLDTTPRLAVGEHSPLLGGEHSPLLTHSTDDKFTSCYSTSEETLSDRHAEPFDDLDDMLTCVEPHQGSFGSLSAAEGAARRPSPIDIEQQLIDVQHEGVRRTSPSYTIEYESKPPFQGSAGYLYDRFATFSSREPCLSDTSDETAISPNQLRSTISAPVIAVDLGDGAQVHALHSHPQGSRVAASLLSPVSPAAGHIPHIQVQYATPCPSESSTQSDRSLERSMSQGEPAGSRRASGTDSTGRTSSFTSLDELSLNGTSTPAIAAPSVAVMAGAPGPKPMPAPKPTAITKPTQSISGGMVNPLQSTRQSGQSGVSLSGSLRQKSGAKGSLADQPTTSKPGSSVSMSAGLPSTTRAGLSGNLVGQPISKAGPVSTSGGISGVHVSKPGTSGSLASQGISKMTLSGSMTGPPTMTPTIKPGPSGPSAGPPLSPLPPLSKQGSFGSQQPSTRAPPSAAGTMSSVTSAGLSAATATVTGPTPSGMPTPSSGSTPPGHPSPIPSSQGMPSQPGAVAAGQQLPPHLQQGRGRRDNDSVQEFQEYLRTRGLEVDLSVVQSSDV